MMSSSERMCAGRWTGQADDDTVLRALATLDDPEIDDWGRLVARAMLLEHRGGPRPMTRAEVREVLEEAFDAVAPTGQDDRARWDAKIDVDLGRLSDSDACFLARSLYEGALRHPPERAARYLRALAEARNQ